MTSTTVPTMSQRQFDDLRKIIYDRSGIHFPDNKKYVLESRLAQRLTDLEMDDYAQYVALLSMGPFQVDEFQEMFNRITINETSFFRNEPQLDYFEKHVLGEMIEARKREKRLRIWSAACSTGEEPYTLAMMVHRTLGVRLADWKVQILGTDISEKALNLAEEARYTNYAVRTMPDIARQRYFKVDGQFFVLDPTIKSMVNFELLNLMDKAAARRHGVWDVIFCRNVMIYFDDAGKTKVMKMFGDQLAPDGRVFIGHSESLRGLEVPFSVLPVPQAFCYTKTATVQKAAA